MGSEPPQIPPKEPKEADTPTDEDVPLDSPSDAHVGLGIHNGIPSKDLPPAPSPSEPATPSVDGRPSLATPSVMTGHRSRSSTTTTAISLSNLNSPGPQLSIVLIMPPLQLLVNSKEAKKSPSFHAAAQRALNLCQVHEETNAAYLHPREIFEPLRLAISNPQTTSVPILVTSLDLLSKLISHSFFSEPQGPPPGLPPLPDLITHTITLSYSEHSPPQVALQVVKALMAIVLSTDKGMLVHQSSLLKAVRTVYNVFLLSTDSANQVVAQGGLTQMVHHVFGRIVRPDVRTAGFAGSARESLSENEARRKNHENSVPLTPAPTTPNDTSAKLTLESFAEQNPNDQIPVDLPPIPDADRTEEEQDEGDGIPRLPQHTVSIPVPDDDALGPGSSELFPKSPVHSQQEDPRMPQLPSEQAGDEEDGNLDAMGQPIPTEQLFAKDAFLVFRALCKLTMKPLVTDSEKDLRSHAMRSKLLSLHLILTILKSHSDLFVNPFVCIPSNSSLEMTPFLQATKQYLCLSLSRNALSPVIQVFELSVEIFWCMLKSMRAQLKKEIEVLLNEIFIPILEMRHSTIRQKSVILGIFIRLCHNPQAVVEMYINYDCDRSSLENIYERLMNIVSKIGQTHFAPPSKEEIAREGAGSKQGGSGHGPAIPPSLSTSALGEDEEHNAQHYTGMSPGTKLRRQSLECLVATLQSLVAWSTPGPGRGQQDDVQGAAAGQEGDGPGRHLHSGSISLSNTEPSLTSPQPAFAWPSDSIRPASIVSGLTTSDPGILEEDDVGKFESAKQRKTNLLEGIKKFNFKPKRGIAYLLEQGFIRSSSPQVIARFLLNNDGLNKAMIGEYLGEVDENNVATMHAFVDMLEFSGMKFTDALRMFLQSFRLPGEAQKIDRFMLKFAERYMQNNPSTLFANADTAYILSFSVIMLNTDAHNKNFKAKRMTKQEFLKNNRGINDGKDLPEELLSDIYDEVTTNEIKMKDEVEVPQTVSSGGLASVGRDLQREAYVAQSENMANKTESLLKAMVRQQKRGVVRPTDHYHTASRLEHVQFMFEVAWMPFLAGISASLQETDDMDVVNLCLQGLKSAIRIVCLFDMELERNAFVTTLAKFTYLNNVAEMKPKNMEAIKTLLEVAVTDGNHLKASWKEVLTCVSQLERMQLISSGMDVPDLNRTFSKKRAPAEEVAEESRSSQVTVAADMVFSTSKNLSGSAIVDFVKALSEVSWEEIQSSGASTHPRMFSLQKLVEISYYNMKRIRLEWSNIWLILGEHFNQVCCHNNPNISFFALDALRQLAMNFLEKEELSHFRFQKDFLRPFEYTIIHNKNSDAREMVLQCLQHMLQSRMQNLRSGWRTMFGVFSAASKVVTERVCNYAFELVTLVYRDYFSLVVKFGSFSDLTTCITDFCKVSKFQKISLQAIEMVRGLVPKMLQCPECLLPQPGEDGKAPQGDDPMVKYWLPVLHSFYEIIMTGEDLEVRRLALDCLFGTLKVHGSGFSVEFWNTVCQEVLFPIFAVLRAKSDVRFRSPEDLSVWLSTTLISALRDLVDLYTVYFEVMQKYLEGLLDILVACICQENDTLARIGTSCFEQLLEQNVHKLSPEKWMLIVSAFVQLFRTTTAYQLFDKVLSSEIEPTGSDMTDNDAPFQKFVAPAPLEPATEKQHSLPPNITFSEQKRIFKQVIVKCVLQLLLIETTHELLQNDEVYNTIPAEHLPRLLEVLEDSWRFARKFNADKPLRMQLWKVGFMKQLPNLLKQESSSAATLISVLLKMYRDSRDAHRASRDEVTERLVPLATEIIKDFISLDPENSPRNVAAWTPVVIDILQGCCSLETKSFERCIPTFYPLITDILLKDVAVEMRLAIRNYLRRAVPFEDMHLYPLHISGQRDEKVNLMFFADGYTQDEEEKFDNDAAKLKDDIVSAQGAMSHVSHLLNIWATFIPSNTSGIGDHDESILGAPFGLYRPGAELRAVFVRHHKKARAACRWFHDGRNGDMGGCDQPIILGNDPLYGGLGGEFTIVTASKMNGPIVLRHELGHSLINVGEEYEGGSSYFGVNSEEPSRLNNLKWKNFVSDSQNLRIEDAKVPLQVYAWHNLDESPWNITFRSFNPRTENHDKDDIPYPNSLLRASLTSIPDPSHINIKLNGFPLNLSNVFPEEWKDSLDRRWLEIPLMAIQTGANGGGVVPGQNVVEVYLTEMGKKARAGQGGKMMSSMEIVEYGGNGRFNHTQGFVGAFPTYDVDGHVHLRPVGFDFGPSVYIQADRGYA
nr:guanine nucleotide exchange protein for ADP-robosylation factor [Cryptococcus depauperatus CBS 7855]